MRKGEAKVAVSKTTVQGKTEKEFTKPKPPKVLPKKAEALAGPAAEILNTTSADACTVVVVDDNPTFASVIDRFLTRKGYSVIIAENSQSALAALKSGDLRP